MTEVFVFDDLIGKTVISLESGTAVGWKFELSEPDYLRFTTSDGEQLAYASEGECCSRSWFNHLSGLDFLIGQRVVSIDEKLMIDLRDGDDEGDEDNVKVYGWTLRTTLGYVDLELRNVSNGYYGGWAEQIDRPVENIVWKPVVADF